MPGHRPPLFFLVGEIEQLWIALHLHDWRKLLADTRVRLFCGANAAGQLRQCLEMELRTPWPRLALTIDNAIWPVAQEQTVGGYAHPTGAPELGQSGFDSVLAAAREKITSDLERALAALDQHYAEQSPAVVAARLRSGEALRILGITSRYTTFLQHSMRDWLAGFEELGHVTELVIEDADHEVSTNLVYARACAEFRPDVVLIIDHYRAEFGGLPQCAPCVMWVQDFLPNIFRPQAGAAQGRWDYVLGHGMQECVELYGYPAGRFMPAGVGSNPKRFAPRPLGADEAERFTCDISFVSHSGTPAETILAEQIEKIGSAEGKRLLTDVFERLKAIYDGGGAITHPRAIEALIRQSLLATKTEIAPAQMPALAEFFTGRINNTLYRHQTLAWAAEMDVEMHLYGRGWEMNPRFKKFARGVADNQSQLSAIYQASRINLQVVPFGVVHQRLLDGLSAGGFFLLREHGGDRLREFLPEIVRWVREGGARSNVEIRNRATPEIRALIERVNALMGTDLLDSEQSYAMWLEMNEAGDYLTSASAVWPEYDQVAFGSRDELHGQIQHFLSDPGQRRRIAESMRRPVIEHFTYAGITRRLLDFVAADLERGAAVRELAA
jgi:hypothetical protein